MNPTHPMPGVDTPTPTLVTFAQRCLLLDVLEGEYRRLYAEEEKLDQAMSARFGPDVVIDESNEDAYDRDAAAVERAGDRANEVCDLHTLLEQAKLMTLRPDPEADAVGTVARALVASWADGRDVGEVLALAVASAQRTVHVGGDGWLTENRPGSWEADLLRQIIDASGWDRS